MRLKFPELRKKSVLLLDWQMLIQFVKPCFRLQNFRPELQLQVGRLLGCDVDLGQAGLGGGDA